MPTNGDASDWTTDQAMEVRGRVQRMSTDIRARRTYSQATQTYIQSHCPTREAAGGHWQGLNMR
jgi:hypothetical protein